MTAAIACGTPTGLHVLTGRQLCNPKLLIISQDRSLGESYRQAACALGFSSVAQASDKQALCYISCEDVDLVLLDFGSPVTRGLEILRQIKAQLPRTEVIVTASASAEVAVQAMKSGAHDYLSKPFTVGELKLSLDAAAAQLKSRIEERQRCEHLKTPEGFGAMVGRSAEMQKLYRLISKSSRYSHSVLIQGESGTGKEMVARAIHYSGPRSDKPFIPVDCGSLVPSLIESELFGYVKGAFTGATQSKDGLLKIADGGTVFLDEIGELAPELQAKLLRVLQEKEIRPVGSTKSVPVNVRVLAATNRDLEAAVAQGSFRLDLFYRLNVLSLRVPPLRERRQDIPVLAARFLERCSRASGHKYQLSEQALQVLVAHDWPGNVRELENCIERCCAMSSGPIIHSSEVPHSVSTLRASAANGDSPHWRIVPLSNIERQTILSAVEQLGGDKITAAKLLGIGKTTLYRKLKEYGYEVQKQFRTLGESR